MADTPLIKTVTLGTDAGIPHGTELETPAGMPNIVVKVRSPFRRTTTRIARVYVNSLLGMLSVVMGDMAPTYITPPDEFMDKLLLAGGLSLAPASIQLLTNLAEYLAKADN